MPPKHASRPPSPLPHAQPPTTPAPPPPPPSLPPPRTLLTNLLTTPSTPHPPTDLSPPAPFAPKPLLLTLHALFPTSLLPALDLLDRRLVTRLVSVPPSSGQRRTAVDARGDAFAEGQAVRRSGTGARKGGGGRMVYYVGSAARRDGRSRYGGATSYEVRTRGWSCSCAAFAFAAFSAPLGGGEGPGGEECGGYGGAGDGGGIVPGASGGDDGDGGVEDGGGWEWGGLMVGADVPLCKHLLACVLAERWDGAGTLVEEREVGREEMAGWGAGWGG